MNLRDQVLKEHTKRNCEKIIRWVGNDSAKFNELFNLFLNDEYRVTQRPAWPLSYCVINHPDLMKNNFEKLIGNLKKDHLHNSIKRNTVRLLQAIDIPQKHEGAIMEICFRYVESPAEPVAVKAFSLTILGKLAKKYPEIIPEIKMLVEEQIPHQTAAFKARAKRVLKELI